MADHKATPTEETKKGLLAICARCGRRIHVDAKDGWKHSPYSRPKLRLVKT